MKIERVLSRGLPARATETIPSQTMTAHIVDFKTGEVIHHQEDILAPANWSQQAVNIASQKYFRKAGVPSVTVPDFEERSGLVKESTLPSWLRPRKPDENATFGGETSVFQLLHRLAGAWTYHGWLSGLLSDSDTARMFYQECYLAMAYQYAAPNSPQWFNTGLFWAYGIRGPDSGMWVCDDDSGGVARQIRTSYERPQPHACFLTPVTDDLVNPGGIMSAWNTEARIFKHGSGSGMNVSTLRGKGESLSGGGKSSGVMSFLRIGDSAAGAIQSGGTTRRAAVLRLMNDDHPEIEEFIDWKVREEAKAAAMYVGSQIIRDAYLGNSSFDDPMTDIPPQVAERAVKYEPEIFGVGWEQEANRSIDGQNSNNSVRVTDAFMRAVENGDDWHLTARTTGEVMKTLPAQHLWGKICKAAWACADPGLLFHDTINAENTCKADGDITTSNPCCEFHHITGNACNLASLKLTAFLRDGKFDVACYEHVASLFTMVLDISVSMASFPDRVFAEMTYQHRTLGLGYTDLGGLLMRMGIPYDSDTGRSLAAALTALMTGCAYNTSAEMAKDVGAYPGYERNERSHYIVMQHHYDAVVRLASVPANEVILSRARAIWSSVRVARSFRNAQATLIAPTGTISFILDSDTTGMECELALKKYKHLAGGGSMEIINGAVPEALKKLRYTESEASDIVNYVSKTGSVEGAPHLLAQHYPVFDCSNPAPGMTRALRWQAHVEMLAAIQPFLSGAASKTINLPNSATVEDISQAYMMSWKKGVKAVALYRDGCKLSQPLQTTPIEKKMDSTSKAAAIPEGMQEAVDEWLAHMNKTSAPVQELPEVAAAVHEVAAAVHTALGVPERLLKLPVDMTPEQELDYKRYVEHVKQLTLQRGQKLRLPWRRTGGYTQKVKIGSEGQSVFWRVSEYADGQPGEIFITLSGEGSTMRAFAECLAISMSVGLQYGVPVEDLAENFLYSKFEPSGYVEGHEHVKFCTSIADLIAKDLLINYCERIDLSQTAVRQNTAELSPREMIEESLVIQSKAVTTGEPCPRCGTALQRAGACQRCPNCFFDTGCG